MQPEIGKIMTTTQATLSLSGNEARFAICALDILADRHRGTGTNDARSCTDLAERIDGALEHAGDASAAIELNDAGIRWLSFALGFSGSGDPMADAIMAKLYAASRGAA